jgi:hypothetical protein
MCIVPDGLGYRPRNVMQPDGPGGMRRVAPVGIQPDGVGGMRPGTGVVVTQPDGPGGMRRIPTGIQPDGPGGMRRVPTGIIPDESGGMRPGGGFIGVMPDESGGPRVRNVRALPGIAGLPWLT